MAFDMDASGARCLSDWGSSTSPTGPYICELVERAIGSKISRRGRMVRRSVWDREQPCSIHGDATKLARQEAGKWLAPYVREDSTQQKRRAVNMSNPKAETDNSAGDTESVRGGLKLGR